MSFEKATQSFLTAVLFVIVFFGFYFVFIEFKSNEKEMASSDSVDIRRVEKRIDDAVNRHLRNVDTETRMRKLIISAENSELSSSFKNKSHKWEPQPKSNPGIYDIDLSQGQIDSSELSVEEQLRAQMQAREDQAQNQQVNKQEYIKAYKRNALQDGWVVEINDDLEIVSAKRVGQ